MKRISVALFMLAFALCAPLQAQGVPPIEKRMSAEELRATGLDKLSAAELAQLNAWLARSAAPSAAAIEQAREEGRQEVVRKHRGFFDFGNAEPIESRIAGEFRGFGSGRTYVLENGETWQQTDSTSLHGVRGQNLAVTIRPGALGAWWMRVEGSYVQAKVKRVK